MHTVFFSIIHTPKSLSYSVFYVLYGNVKSSRQRKPGKILKMSTEGGQQNKFILTS